MVDKATAVEAEIETDEDDEPAAQEKEPLNRSQKADPFAAAFEAAEAEVEGDAEPKRAPKPKKVKAEDDEPEDKPAKPAKKAPPKATAKDADVEDDDEATDQDEDEDAPKGKAKEAAPAKSKTEKPAKDDAEDDKPAEPKKKEPLGPKQWWPKEKREAFAYQPREVQETWLKERPVADAHWSEEQKANFAKLPAESQEVLIVQAREFERGYQTKFQALATERKTFEAMKAAVSPEMRAHMQKLNLDEPAVFSRLLSLQAHSMKDPVGYIRNFIANSRIDPRSIFPAATGDDGTGQPSAQPGAAQQADITSHPFVQTMVAELNTLKQAVMTDQQRRASEDDRRRGDEIEGELQDKDEEGNSRYPYIRVLSHAMSEIIEANPEHFSSMGVRQQIAEAYRQALQGFPELTPPKKTVTPAPVDEPEEEETDSEEETRVERLKKAATKKSKTPQTAAPNASDPFSKAFSRAERQIGHR